MKQIVFTMTIILDFDKYRALGIDKPKEDIIARFEMFADAMATSIPEFSEVLSLKTKVEEIDV